MKPNQHDPRMSHRGRAPGKGGMEPRATFEVTLSVGREAPQRGGDDAKKKKTSKGRSPIKVLKRTTYSTSTRLVDALAAPPTRGWFPHAKRLDSKRFMTSREALLSVYFQYEPKTLVCQGVEEGGSRWLSTDAKWRFV